MANYKSLKGALDSVLLKGKYSSSTTSKIGVINDCVVAIIESMPIPQKSPDNPAEDVITGPIISDNMNARPI